MKAELLTIGNEILIGQIVNTNAVWMAQQLNMIGVSVVHMSSVADEEVLFYKLLMMLVNARILFLSLEDLVQQKMISPKK